MMKATIEPIDSRIFQLAEGPMYDRGSYYWVDINTRELIKFRDGEIQTLKVDTDYLTSVVLTENDQLLVSGKDQLLLISDMKNSLPLEVNLELASNTRFNDAKVDPWGNYWIGSMDLNFDEPLGSLFCMDTRGKVTKMLEGVICSNGLCWNESKELFYYIDSKTQLVKSYHFDVKNNRLNDEKVIFEEKREGVYPDGMTIDTEGFLYVAMWGGSEVIKLDPMKGNIVEKYALPCPNVTSCCFAGEDLNELLITTASVDTEKSSYPEAGRVFKMKTQAKGFKANKVKLSWK